MDNCPVCGRAWPDDLIAGRLAGCRVCAQAEQVRLKWFDAQYKRALRKVQTNG